MQSVAPETRSAFDSPWVQPRRVVLVATLLTLVALAESSVLPWAPFYLLYVSLAVFIPLRLRTTSLEPRRRLGGRTWLVAAGIGIGFQIVGALLFGVMAPAVFRSFGVDAREVAGPGFSLDAALQLLFQRFGTRWDLDGARLLQLYLGFIVLWAGAGEELFYRGYVHGSLQRARGFGFATAVSAFYFAVRHAVQLASLGTDYPWGAAMTWVVFAGLFGIVASILYARTRSLWPGILAHYVLNLIPFVASLATGSQ